MMDVVNDDDELMAIDASKKGHKKMAANATITFRISKETFDRMKEAQNKLIYPTTATAIIDRGIKLALDEIDRMTKSHGDCHKADGRR